MPAPKNNRVKWMAARTKHGEYAGGRESPEHYIWRTMLRRQKHKRGGHHYVGVKVCSRWLEFENFLVDMGRRPGVEYSLERDDVLGDYEPTNCRWATHSEQQKNKKTTKRWVNSGQSGTLGEWADRLGISKQCAAWRMKHWNTFERGREWQLQKRK